MEFQCPRCGVALETVNSAIHTQCPACGALFRTEEVAAFTHRQQDEVIDVHAEVISSEYDGAYVERAVEPLQGAYEKQGTGRNANAPFIHNMTFDRREGCSCSGCGCLAVLLLLLFLLFGW